MDFGEFNLIRRNIPALLLNKVYPPRQDHVTESYLVLSGNGGQMTPVAVVGDVSGSPGRLLMWRREAAATGLLHLLHGIREQPRGQLRRFSAFGLHLLSESRSLQAVSEDVGFPQPGAVHQQRRCNLFGQVGIFYIHVVGRHDPGHGAPEGVAPAKTQEAGAQRQGKVTGPHGGRRTVRSHPLWCLQTHVWAIS